LKLIVKNDLAVVVWKPGKIAASK